MAGLDFQHLIGALGELTGAQRQTAMAVLSGQGDLAAVTALIEARFGERARCPHCKSLHVRPWGRAAGLRRYL